MRRAHRLDRLQPDEAADAVIGVHDDVAGRERCHFGDEIGSPLALLRAAHQPVAQNVLLGDDDEAVGLEAGLERQHGKTRLPGFELFRFGQRCDAPQIAEVMLGQDLRQPVERALRPAGDDDTPLAVRAVAICLTTASKTLADGSARSSAKVWPCREPA